MAADGIRSQALQAILPLQVRRVHHSGLIHTQQILKALQKAAC